jgi:putative tricarboxylic transport membrane protein
MGIVNRRELLAGASALGLCATSGIAFGQSDWKPTKDVEFVIPFGVGGGSDLLARVIGKVIAEEKLVPVPVTLNNRPGGGGAVGIGYVSASRRADPHTLILVNGTTQITPILTPAAKTLTEVRPIANFMLDDFIFFVKGDSRWKTVGDFVAEARSKPDKTFAFATGGTTDVMAITIFSRAIGKEINMINFNSGGEALTALLGGHVDGSIGNPLEFMGHLNGGTVRALGVFRDTRFPELPNIPTMKESGIETPNFQMWRGTAVPKGVEDGPARYWEGVMQKVAASPLMKKYIKENAGSEAVIVGDGFVKFLTDQEKLYRSLLAKPS